MQNARSQARDSQRKSDMIQARNAVLSYHTIYGALPTTSAYGETDLGGWDNSFQDDDGDGNNFLDFLVDAGMLGAGMVDPVNSSTDNLYYRYFCYNSGVNATRLRLYAVNLENEATFTAIDEYGYTCSPNLTLPHES